MKRQIIRQRLEGIEAAMKAAGNPQKIDSLVAEWRAAMAAWQVLNPVPRRPAPKPVQLSLF